MSTSTSNWTESENIILLEYCSKKISIKEISTALRKSENNVKFHIGDLATDDYNNNKLSTDDICKKYNMNITQLNNAIKRNTIKNNEKKKKIDNYNSLTDIEYKKQVLQLLTEIRDLLSIK